MSNLEEQILAMQQQMQTMQQVLQNLAQRSTPESEKMDSQTDITRDTGDDTNRLHSLATRPSYEWTPSTFLVEQLRLDQPIHTSPPMDEEQRKKLIESYPSISNLDYKAPATLPMAERKMSKGQLKEDRSLRQIQYLLSAVFRPLDILAHELAQAEQANPNVERYFAILGHIRQLMLHNCAHLTGARNEIAFRAFNPGFTATNNQQTFTMPSETFQASLLQQSSTAKALREAGARKQKRPTSNNFQGQSAFATGDNSQFFRSGPSSQQGGQHHQSKFNQQRPTTHIKKGNGYNPFKPHNQQQ